MSVEMEKIRDADLKSFYEDKKKTAFRIQILFLMDRLRDHKKLLKQCKQKEKEEEVEAGTTLSSEEPAGLLDDLSLYNGVEKTLDDLGQSFHGTTVEGEGDEEGPTAVTGKGKEEEEDIEMASGLTVKENGPHYFLQERSIYEDQVFAKAQFHSGMMDTEEWQAYKTTWDTIVPEEAPHDFLIYLKTNPSICMERMENRGEGDGNGEIDQGYLETLETEYEDWMKNTIRDHMVVFRVDWTKQSNNLEEDIKKTWRSITKEWSDILGEKKTFKAPYPIIDIPSPSQSSH